MIGAVFGEWSGADEGLGHLILVAQGQLQTARVFAAVVVLSALALIAVRRPRPDRTADRLVAAAAHAARMTARARRPAARRRGALLIAIGVLAAAVQLAGCGEKQESVNGATQEFTVALDFYVNPDHAGIYTALDRGYFEQAGLAVDPSVPSDPSAPIREVAAGRVDLAISYEPEVLLAHDQGLPVMAVGALVDRPLDLADLAARGRDRRPSRTCAARRSPPPGIPYQADFLDDDPLETRGSTPDDVDQVDVGLNLLPAVLSGAPTRCSAGSATSRASISPNAVATRASSRSIELGIPTYDELVLVANSDRDRRRPRADPPLHRRARARYARRRRRTPPPRRRRSSTRATASTRS